MLPPKCRAMGLSLVSSRKLLYYGRALLGNSIVSIQTERERDTFAHWTEAHCGLALELAKRTLSAAWRHGRRAVVLFRCCCQTSSGRLTEELSSVTCQSVQDCCPMCITWQYTIKQLMLRDRPDCKKKKQMTRRVDTSSVSCFLGCPNHQWVLHV